MRPILVKLKPSTRKNKKWSIELLNHKNSTIHFGAANYSDYTIHGNARRRDGYLARHAKREDWTIDGVATAGFWSRWLLWNKTSLEAAKASIEAEFNIKFVR